MALTAQVFAPEKIFRYVGENLGVISQNWWRKGFLEPLRDTGRQPRTTLHWGPPWLQNMAFYSSDSLLQALGPIQTHRNLLEPLYWLQQSSQIPPRCSICRFAGAESVGGRPSLLSQPHFKVHGNVSIIVPFCMPLLLGRDICASTKPS